MARLQTPQILSMPGLTTSPVKVSTTEIICTSFIVQNPQSNTDFIVLGNVSGQIYQIAPGKDLAVRGDNLDNGTSAYFNLQDWYIKAESGTQSANILWTDGR